MAHQKTKKGGRQSAPESTFRTGPPCRSVTDIKVGDLVFINPQAGDQRIGHRLGLTKDELKYLPLRVRRVESVNGMIVLAGRRIDSVRPDQIRKAIPAPTPLTT